MNTKSHAIVCAAIIATVLPVFAVQAQDAFQGVGASPDGVTIKLDEVKRVSPQDVMVTWTLHNTTKSAQRLTKGGKGWGDAYELSWDAYLLDSVKRLKIKVARDSQKTPLAAKHNPAGPTAGIVLAAGKSLTTWAKFIVPEDTTQVTVDLPGAPKPWDNVAIKSQ